MRSLMTSCFQDAVDTEVVRINCCLSAAGAAVGKTSCCLTAAAGRISCYLSAVQAAVAVGLEYICSESGWFHCFQNEWIHLKEKINLVKDNFVLKIRIKDFWYTKLYLTQIWYEKFN